MKSLLIILPLLVGGTNIFGGITSSKEHGGPMPQKLYVTNNIGLYRDLLVTWPKAGFYFIKELEKNEVKPGETTEIAEFNTIDDGLNIKLEPTGTIAQYTASPVTVKKEALIAEFRKQAKLLADYFASQYQPAPTNLSLEVVVTQGWTGSLTFEYKTYVTR
jgi:hypothetical protein